MASKLLTALSLLALTGCCLGGFAATYSGFQPAYATYQAAPTFYHAAPAAFYQQATAPVLAKTVLPVAPAYTKSYAVKAVAPVVRAYAAAPAAVAAVAPVVKTVAVAAPLAPVVKQVELESAPRYDFSYGVHDSITGDIKSQTESRDGGNVVGSYSVLDADGYKRTVTYTADDINGFNAVVQREPVVAARTAVVTPVAPVPVVSSAAVATLPAPIYYPQAQQQLFQPQQQLFQPQQQLFQPQQQLFQPQQQGGAEQESEVVEAPRQPDQEPAPVDYSDAQQQPQVYPQDQQFPPYPTASPAPAATSDDSDSDVVEARSAQESSSTTAAPAAVNEENKEQDKKSA